MKYSADGGSRQTRNVDFSIQLRGIVQVRKVTNGHPTEIECRVEKCLLNDRELVRPGESIIGESSGLHPIFKTDNVTIGEMGTEALTLLIPLVEDQDNVTDDEVFGTNEAEGVGATWHIARSAMAQRLSLIGYKADAKLIDGTVSVVSIGRLGDQEAVRVKSQWHVEGLGGRIEGFEVKSGSMHGTISALYPVPLDAPGPIEQSWELKIMQRLAGRTPDGKPLEIDATTEQVSDRKMVSLR
jgi:hypothetical protein